MVQSAQFKPANPTAVHVAVPLIFRDDGKRIRPDRKNTGTVTVN